MSKGWLYAVILTFVSALVFVACGAPEPRGNTPEPEVPVDAVAPTLEGLAGYYPLDGHADDLSERQNHGEIVGATPTTDRFGRTDRALHFDGQDDYVALAAPAIDDRTRWFTMSIWFRSAVTSKAAIFFEAEANGPGIWVRMNPKEGVIVSHARDAFTVKSAFPYNDNKWHHLVLKASDAGVSLWVDATMVAESDWSQDFNLKKTPRATVIGRAGEADGEQAFHHFKGDLDELAVFHRPLDGNEIKALFKEGPNQAPVAQADVTPSGNDVTVNGAGSSDRDGEIVEYSWDFGDGTDPKTGREASHTYGEPGVYEVTLIVTDDEGETSQTTVTIEVLDDGTTTPVGDGDGDPSAPDDGFTGDDDWPAKWAEFEDKVLVLVNQRRAAGAQCDGEAFGPAPALEANGYCRLSARLHAEDMAKNNYFSHTGLNGSSPFDRMADAGYNGPAPWGENIAAGQSSPEAVVDGWMHSPGHCRNIMNAGFRVLGMGYYYSASSAYGHLWVQNFGGGH